MRHRHLTAPVGTHRDDFEVEPQWPIFLRSLFYAFICAVAIAPISLGLLFHVGGIERAASPAPASAGPTALTKTITVNATTPVALQFSTSEHHNFGVCRVDTAGVNVFVVSSGAANTANGEGPYTSTSGPFIIGQDFALADNNGNVRCRFYDATLGAGVSVGGSAPSVFTTTVDGLVPHPGSTSGKFLEDNGTWGAALSGAFSSSDFVVGNVANNSLQSIHGLDGNLALTFVAEAGVPGVPLGGSYLLLDNANINESGGLVVRSHNGWGDTNNAIFGDFASGGIGHSFGIAENGASFHRILFDVLDTNGTVELATHDTRRLRVRNDDALGAVEVSSFLDGANASATSDAGTGSCSSVTVSGTNMRGTVNATCTVGQTVDLNFGGGHYASAPFCWSNAGTSTTTTPTTLSLKALVALTAVPITYGCEQ